MNTKILAVVALLVLSVLTACSAREITTTQSGQPQTPYEIAPEGQQIAPVMLKLDKTKYGELINRYCADFLQLKINPEKSIQMQKLELEIMKTGANQCYIDIATFTNDEKICELTAEQFYAGHQLHWTSTEAREYCLKDVGAHNSRPELCGQITMKEIKDLCFEDLEFLRKEKTNGSQ